MLTRVIKLTPGRVTTARHIFVVTKTYSISVVTVFAFYAEYAMIYYCDGFVSNRFCHRQLDQTVLEQLTRAVLQILGHSIGGNANTFSTFFFICIAKTKRRSLLRLKLLIYHISKSKIYWSVKKKSIDNINHVFGPFFESQEIPTISGFENNKLVSSCLRWFISLTDK